MQRNKEKGTHNRKPLEVTVGESGLSSSSGGEVIFMAAAEMPLQAKHWS